MRVIRMTQQIKPRTVSTLYFIGVTTTQSSIMKVFPRWSDILGLDARIITQNSATQLGIGTR